MQENDSPRIGVKHLAANLDGIERLSLQLAQLLEQYEERTTDALGSRWLEWDTTDPATPDEFRELPSPTIWVNGRDVDSSASAASGRGCRIYIDGGVTSGVPSVALLVQALQQTDAEAIPAVASAPHHGAWQRALAVLPSLGIATVPVGLCPVCFAG